MTPPDKIEITSLPDEILASIAGHLAPEDVVSLGRANSRMRTVTHLNTVWKKLIEKDFGVTDTSACEYRDYAWYRLGEKIHFLQRLTKYPKTHILMKLTTAWNNAHTLSTHQRREQYPLILQEYKKTLKNLPSNAEMPWENYSPIEWASNNNNMHLLKELLMAGVTYRSMEALGPAIRDGNLEVVQMFITYKKDLNEWSASGETALTMAASGNNNKIFKTLLAAPSVDINLCNAKNKSPLDVAIEFKKIDAIQSLLKDSRLKITPEKMLNILLTTNPDESKETTNIVISHPLFEENIYGFIKTYIKNGDLVSMKKLLQYGNTPINKRDAQGDSLLLIAMKNRKYDMFVLLIDQNIDINLKNNNGITPLMYAASENLSEYVTLLLAQKNIQCNSKNNNGETALHIAKEKKHRLISISIENAIEAEMNKDCDSTRNMQPEVSSRLKLQATTILNKLPSILPIEMRERTHRYYSGIFFSRGMQNHSTTNSKETSLQNLRTGITSFIEIQKMDINKYNQLFQSIQTACDEMREHYKKTPETNNFTTAKSKELMQLNMALNMSQRFIDELKDALKERPSASLFSNK